MSHRTYFRATLALPIVFPLGFFAAAGACRWLVGAPAFPPKAFSPLESFLYLSQAIGGLPYLALAAFAWRRFGTVEAEGVVPVARRLPVIYAAILFALTIALGVLRGSSEEYVKLGAFLAVCGLVLSSFYLILALAGFERGMMWGCIDVEE